MTRKEFDEIVNQLHTEITRQYKKQPHYVHFTNKKVSDNNVMFLVKMICIADGLTKTSGMIISITNVVSAIGQELFIVSPIYSYDEVTKEKEEESVTKIGEMLEKICGKIQLKNNNYMIICETGDFKVSLSEIPEISNDGEIVRIS